MESMIYTGAVKRKPGKPQGLPKFDSQSAIHCCMKCPQILREKTSSEKYTVISLRIQWKLSAEGNAFRK